MKPSVTVVARITLVVLLTVVGVITAAPPAYACSLVPAFVVDLDLLSRSTPIDIAQPDGVYGTAFAAWVAEGNGGDDTGFPTIVSVERRRTVIEALPPDETYASDGGVTVVDAVWGSSDDITPAFDGFDASSCFFGPPALGKSRWSIETETANYYVDIRVPNSENAAMEQQLTRLFGEPLRPERDTATEEAALAELLEYGERQFGQRVDQVERLTPLIVANPAEDATQAENGLSPVIWFALAGLAGVVGVGTTVRKRSRPVTF